MILYPSVCLTWSIQLATGIHMLLTGGRCIAENVNALLDFVNTLLKSVSAFCEK